MRSKLLLCLALACLPLFSGCIYLNVKIPLDTDLNQTKLGSKVGKSEAQSVCWLFAWGDAGTAAAAADGGITQLNHADEERFVILGGVYARSRTVVYGD